MKPCSRGLSIQKVFCSCCFICTCLFYLSVEHQMTRVCVFLMSRLPSPNIMCVISVLNVYLYVLWWCFVSHVLMLNITSCFPYTLCPLTPALIFCPVTGCLYRRYVTRTARSHHSLISTSGASFHLL